MKQAIACALCLTLLLSACASQPAPAKQPEVPSDTTTAQENQSSAAIGEGGILVVWFSVPEDIDPAGVDAVSGASIVVDDGEKLGNVQYMAQIIQEAAGGDSFRLETVQEYPLEHEALVNFAADEKAEDARPELTALPENLDQYGTIFLGYPNWWADLPMPVYAFLESVDLSGKTIIPFCPHGGSGFSRTVSTIAELQPDGVVSEDGLTISRGEAAGAKDEITAWVQNFGF